MPFWGGPLRSIGWNRVNYRIEEGFPDDLALPAIAGVRLGGVGHFIAILGLEDEGLVVGDPLVGRKSVPLGKLRTGSPSRVSSWRFQLPSHPRTHSAVCAAPDADAMGGLARRPA